jgi:hypothetical protein
MANFSLLAKIGLDSKGFQKGLDKAKSGVSKFGKGVLNASNKLAKMGLGAAAAGFALLSKNAIALGSELSDIAANTGFATEEFQVFRGALIDAGGASKSMEKAIVIMQKAVVQGSEGLTTYKRAFERIGLSVDDLRKMRPEEQFNKIGKAIAGATDQQGALTAAIEIFGQKNAGRLIEVFKRLDKDGYGKMAEDIKKTYGIMDTETQLALDKAADTIERFKNKATIEVGELIAGEADGASMKQLGFKLMENAAKFGISLAEGFMDAVAIGRNAFGAFADFFFDKMSSTIGLVGTLIKISFAEALNPMIEKLNQIPKINIEPIDTKKLNDDLTKDLEKGNKSFFQYFNERQAEQEKFEIGYDPSKFWKEASEAEESKLEMSRKAAKEARAAAEAEIAAITGEGGSAGGEGAEGGDNTEEAKKEKLKKLEEQIKDMKLKALRAQANGDKDAQASMEKRVELARKIVSIMKEFGVSQEEATSLANKTKEEDPEQKRSSLTGRDLQKAANIAGKGQAGDKSSFLGGKDIRFERDGKGNFQQFIGGKKGQKFTEEQMQAGLQKQVDKDGSEGLLEKINSTLEGKFVSQ